MTSSINAVFALAQRHSLAESSFGITREKQGCRGCQTFCSLYFVPRATLLATLLANYRTYSLAFSSIDLLDAPKSICNPLRPLPPSSRVPFPIELFSLPFFPSLA